MKSVPQSTQPKNRIEEKRRKDGLNELSKPSAHVPISRPIACERIPRRLSIFSDQPERDANVRRPMRASAESVASASAMARSKSSAESAALNQSLYGARVARRRETTGFPRM